MKPHPLLVMVGASLAAAAASGWLLTLDTASGWPFWASNVSAVWLLLPFLFGWQAGRVTTGALWGVAMTWACLCVYYAVASAQYGHHLDNVLRFGTRYAVFGVATGAVLGALGGWWRHHPIRVVPVLIFLAFALERYAWRWKIGWSPASPVFSMETLVGLAAAALLLQWRRRALSARRSCR